MIADWDYSAEPEPRRDLPSLPYAKSLQNVTELKPEIALKLLKLVERRETILEQTDATAFYETSYSALFEFEGLVAELILSALDVLKEVNYETDWPFEDIDPRSKEKLRKIVFEFRNPVKNKNWLSTAPADRSGMSDHEAPASQNGVKV